MIVIIGAGPAGLSAAYHLQDTEYVVLERETEPGGLCRSFELDGAMFDLGGHAFFTRHDYVRGLVSNLCEPGLYTQARRAWVYTHGTFVPYPFQSHLHGLPVEVVEECLVGLYEAATCSGQKAPPGNVVEWIARSFGAGIGKHFLVPYNEKVWAFPLNEVSPEWTSERIVTPDVRAIVAGALQPVEFTGFPNATVTYPASGGYFNLYRGFLPIVGERIRQVSAERVDAPRRRVWTSDGRYVDYEFLITTMPLDQLISRTEGLNDCCRQAAAALRHNSLYLVNLVVDRPRVTDMQRVYVADPSIPFHKLVFNSNSSEELRRSPRFAIQAEVTWSTFKPVNPTGLERRVLEWITRIGILRADDRVTRSSVVTVPYAYPVYTVDTAAHREHLLDALREFGILGTGRFGEWLYINSDQAVMSGKARADEVRSAAR